MAGVTGRTDRAIATVRRFSQDAIPRLEWLKASIPSKSLEKRGPFIPGRGLKGPRPTNSPHPDPAGSSETAGDAATVPSRQTANFAARQPILKEAV
jgi:hypothetical protein